MNMRSTGQSTGHADHPAATHPASALAARIDAILAALLLVIGAHQHLLGRFALPVWTRISRMRRRFARLLARPLAEAAPQQPASDSTRPEATRTGGASAPYIPRRHGWLVHIIGYQAAAYMSQLEHLLREPETQALLAAASPSWTRAVGRPLRPLCRLLHVTPPAEFQTRPPAPQRAPRKPASPRPIPAPPRAAAEPKLDGLYPPPGINFIFRAI